MMWRRHQADSIKYYLYVSDAKVDMLCAQIPRTVLNRIAAEFKLDAKVLGISLKEKPSDENRYTKLRVVDRYLRDNEDIGTPEWPGVYFQGTLLMRWTILGEGNEIVF